MKLIKTKTKGGNQNMVFVNYNSLLNIFSKTRKSEIIEISNNLNIKINNKIYTCIEAETIKCILDSFNGEKMMQQYKVKQYFIDLYFPEYKLALECDEKQHNVKNNIEKDIIREIYIKDNLDCTFIRYKPYDKEFNIFDIINKIYKHIILYKTK